MYITNIDLIISNYTREVKKVVDQKTQELINTISNLKETPKDEINKASKFLFELACSSFNVKPFEIVKERPSPNAIDAGDVIIVCLKKHTKAKESQIADILCKTRSKIPRTVKKHNNRLEKIKHDKIYLDIFKEIESKFLEYKNNGFYEVESNIKVEGNGN